MRDRKRLVIGLLAGVVIALIGVALLFYLTIVRPLRDDFEGRSAADVRVEPLVAVTVGLTAPSTRGLWHLPLPG